ncbi:hypothetical protein Taro_044478 [Colocasia esculenta]|uniref:Uncharacterized protein n=1 Tax=Colocasia esculenta TaxID=4460 RepID=A0A843WUQ1_COLES|nr:hypothetical protein [Colocasia esculenta]
MGVTAKPLPAAVLNLALFCLRRLGTPHTASAIVVNLVILGGGADALRNSSLLWKLEQIERTRAAFDIALTVHRKIQEKDIEVGRTLGNRILRWLEPMKPSAEMHCSPVRPVANNLLKQIGSSVRASISQRPNVNKFMDRSFRHHLFATSWNRRPTSFPTISMMMQPIRPVGMGIQYWHLSNFAPSRFEGVFRKDIVQWMHRVN